jgi:ribosomal protein L37AE/L43A
MSADSYNVKILCSCGSDQFSSTGKRTADTVMTCAKCGATAKYGGMMKQAKQQITQQYADAIRKAFKK